MRKRFYQAFTLVEMLIVMGILIILMVVGIAAGRYAINRANRVAHQNAADQIYQGLQAYYTENRVFPEPGDISTMIDDETGELWEYMDSGDFQGGAPADYVYIANTGLVDRQSVLICVTLGGPDDQLQRGIYCSGNGFRDATLTIATGVNAGNLSDPFIEYDTTNDIYNAIVGHANAATWNGNEWGAIPTE